MALVSKKGWMLIAGFSFVSMAGVAGFGYGYVFERLYKAQDAVATFHNLQADTGLYNQFVWSFVLVALLDVVVAIALYSIFKTGYPKLASTMAWLRILYTILFVNAISHLFSISCKLEEALPEASVVMLRLEEFLNVWSFALIFFGIHLVMLGLVAYRSVFIPKTIGVLVMFAGVCYFLTNCSNLLIPEYASFKNTVEMVLALPMAMGELGLAVWLIYIVYKKANHVTT